MACEKPVKCDYCGELYDTMNDNDVNRHSYCYPIRIPLQTRPVRRWTCLDCPTDNLTDTEALDHISKNAHRLGLLNTPYPHKETREHPMYAMWKKILNRKQNVLDLVRGPV